LNRWGTHESICGKAEGSGKNADSEESSLRFFERYRQFAAACSLKRAAIVVKKHHMSRSMKKEVAAGNAARKSSAEAGFQIPLMQVFREVSRATGAACLLELH
jgi:hypothetical protein